MLDDTIDIWIDYKKQPKIKLATELLENCLRIIHLFNIRHESVLNALTFDIMVTIDLIQRACIVGVDIDKSVFKILRKVHEELILNKIIDSKPLDHF